MDHLIEKSKFGSVRVFVLCILYLLITCTKYLCKNEQWILWKLQLYL